MEILKLTKSMILSTEEIHHHFFIHQQILKIKKEDKEFIKLKKHLLNIINQHMESKLKI